MKIWDRSFLRYAGAEPARQMRKEQRLAHDAYSQGTAYERPLNDPERPSNKDRAFLEGVLNSLPDSDNPSKIAAALSSFQTPVPEGQELTVVKDGPDNPSSILKDIGSFAPPAPPAPPPPVIDLPAETRLQSAHASQAVAQEPTVADLPAEARPRGEELPAAPALTPTVTDLPAESRPAQEALPAPPPLALTAVDIPVSSRGDSGPAGSSLDLAAELRPAPQQALAPEMTSGLIVSGTA